LLDGIPHIKLMIQSKIECEIFSGLYRGVIIVKKDSTKKLIDFLKGYEAEFYVRDVILLHEDEIALGKSQPTE